jgi:hypothetical protein
VVVFFTIHLLRQKMALIPASSTWRSSRVPRTRLPNDSICLLFDVPAIMYRINVDHKYRL